MGCAWHAEAMGSLTRPRLVPLIVTLVALSCTSNPTVTPSGRSDVSSSAPPVASPAAELRSIGDLRAAFNADQGLTRLILILSPT